VQVERMGEKQTSECVRARCPTFSALQSLKRKQKELQNREEALRRKERVRHRPLALAPYADVVAGLGHQLPAQPAPEWHVSLEAVQVQVHGGAT